MVQRECPADARVTVFLLAFYWKLPQTVWGSSCCLLLGGSGFGEVEECIIAEELFYGCSGVATNIMANGLAVSKRINCGWLTPSLLKNHLRTFFKITIGGVKKVSGKHCCCTLENPPICTWTLLSLWPRAGSGIVRIDPLRFLAGCHKRRLNQV